MTIYKFEKILIFIRTRKKCNLYIFINCYWLEDSKNFEFIRRRKTALLFSSAKWYIFIQPNVLFFFFYNKALDRSLAWRVDIFKWPKLFFFFLSFRASAVRISVLSTVIHACFIDIWSKIIVQILNFINSLNFLNSFDLNNIFIFIFILQQCEWGKYIEQKIEIHRWWILLFF